MTYPTLWGTPRDVLEERRGGGFGTQKYVHQKWPDQIIPMVNFVLSHDGDFGLEGGGGGITPPSSYGVRPFKYFPGDTRFDQNDLALLN